MKGSVKEDGERVRNDVLLCDMRTLDKKRKYGGDGVLSAPLTKAIEKAKKAQCLYDKPERGEYCSFQEAMDIKEVDFHVLEGYTINIDKHFTREGVFRRNAIVIWQS